MTEFSIHGECLILHINWVVSVVTLPAKKKESQKGYIEMNWFFHPGIHLKCAGMVTFTLLLYCQTKMELPCLNWGLEGESNRLNGL